MRSSFFISILFHAAVILVGYFGFAFLPERELIVDAPIVVEVVHIDDVSNVPMPKPQVKDPVEEKPEPPKEQPAPPPPAPEKPTPPEPEPAPEPEPEPEPAPAPEAEVIPQKEPKPEPKPEVQKPQPRVKPIDVARKPEPPKKELDFDSLMKDLAPTLKDAPKVEQKKEDTPALDDFAKDIEAAIKRPSQSNDPSRPMTITEIDALRQHIAKCWNPPIGAKDAENLKIEIEVTMNPDGTPRAASIGSRSNLSDHFYRAAAESALRAVNNRRCWPYPLSEDTYDQWRDLTLVFDPKELLGL